MDEETKAVIAGVAMIAGAVVAYVLVPLAGLGLAVWVVVTVLRWMGVL